MDLRDRLKAMGVRPRASGGVSTSPTSPATPQNPTLSTPEIARPLAALSRKQVRLDQALPGAWHETPDGPCFAVERRYSVGLARGPVLLGSVLQTRPRVLWDAGRASALHNLDARKLLFLDTETTGLSGGTGTYVFLVGVAFFSEAGDEVVVRQYFLSDLSAEHYCPYYGDGKHGHTRRPR